METNETNGPTIRNRKRKTKVKEQTCLDENKDNTKPSRCMFVTDLVKNLSLIYASVSVLFNGLHILSARNGNSVTETKGHSDKTGTNAFDDSFLSELDKANEFYFQGQMKEALEKYSEIVTKQPQNAQALWGYAKSLDTLGAQTHNKYFIIDAKVALFDAISLPDVPRDIFIKALARLTQLYIATEPVSSLDELWRFLSTRYSYTLEPKRLFMRQLMRHKQTLKLAENKLIEMIDVRPDDCLSMAMLGQLYNNKGKQFEKAVHFLQRAIDLDCQGIRSRKIYVDLYQVYIRLKLNNKAAEVTRLGAERGLFLSAVQRSKSNADTPLTARPWWTYEQSTYRDSLEFLESHWKEIRDEGLAILKQGPGPFKDDAENIRDEGIWQKMVLFRQGHRMDRNCEMAPVTCRLLDKVPDATTLTRGQIKFSVLTPGTHLLAHSGPTNCRIRAHLGLQIPEGPIIRVVDQNRTWVEGKFIIFDDSFEHEVWHEGTDGSRLVLIVDFWHPDISMEQRKRIRRFN